MTLSTPQQSSKVTASHSEFQQQIRLSFPQVSWNYSPGYYYMSGRVGFTSLWIHISYHPFAQNFKASLLPIGWHDAIWEKRSNDVEVLIESLRQYLNSLADSLKDAALPPVEAQP